MNCPVCGAADCAPYCEKGPYRIRRCASCASGFLEKPEGFDPAAFYKEGYHRKEEGSEATHGYDDYYAMAPAFAKTFGQRLSDLRGLQPGPGKRSLLDVGCGPGFFLEQAAADYSVQGLELGREAAAHARSSGFDVREEAFREGLFPPESFDAVTLFDVIEHLEDPAAALREVGRVLKPNGVVMLSTGDFESASARLSGTRWHLLTPPEHLFYFSRRGLCGLLERLGFDALWTRYPAGHFPLDYLVEKSVKVLGAGLGYRKLGGVRDILKKAVLPVNLWDVMLVAARRRPS